MDIFTQITRQIADIFKRMSPIQRTNFILLTGIMVILTIAIAVWSGRTDYALLYSNLNAKDAGSIKTKLDELKIETKVEGNSIYVPSSKVYETRLMLANEGLPQGGGVGYEIFGKGNFAMTDYLQQINYKRALEGELSRTINTIKGINNSRVHLALPKKGLFEEQDNRSTASVIIDVGQSYPLTKQQVGGIVHLVSSSVEGLSPDSVSVIDSKGNLLFGDGGAEGGEFGLSSSQLEAKKSVENYLEKKAESMLTTILGPGKAIVRVAATMDFDRIERTNEKFDPEGAVPRVETSTEEQQSETAGAEGVTPGTAVAAGSTAGRSTSKTQAKSQTSYEISKTIERITSSVGNVKKLYVAVVVDGTYKTIEAAPGEKKPAQKEYLPRSAEEKAMYKKLVANAIGIDAARGDEIEVSDASFDTSIFEEQNTAMAAIENKNMMSNTLKQGGTVLVFVVAFIFLFLMLKKVSSTLPAAAPAAVPSAVVPDAVAAYKAAAAPSAVKPEGGAVSAEHAVPGGVRPETPVVTEQDLRTVAQQEPEAVASVVKEWLTESV